MSNLLNYCPLLALFVSQTLASPSFENIGVDWFGEPRGGFDSFYDIIYDDEQETGCGGELRSTAVSNHIFLGALLTSLLVDSSTDCLQECYLNEKCRSANYFMPGTYDKNRGYCELINETQWDDMTRTMWWMRPYKGAVHYEHIQCHNPQYFDPNIIINKHIDKMKSTNDVKKDKPMTNINDLIKSHKPIETPKMDPFAQTLFKKLSNYMKTYTRRS